MRNKGLAAGNHALRLYVSAMRLHGSRHYPHGPSAANGLSGSTSCMRGYFQGEGTRPSPQVAGERAKLRFYESRFSMALRAFLWPVLAAASQSPHQPHPPDSGEIGASPVDLKMLVNIRPPLSAPQQWGRQRNLST